MLLEFEMFLILLVEFCYSSLGILALTIYILNVSVAIGQSIKIVLRK